jgi:hypothetical protein
MIPNSVAQMSEYQSKHRDRRIFEGMDGDGMELFTPPLFSPPLMAAVIALRRALFYHFAGRRLHVSFDFEMREFCRWLGRVFFFRFVRIDSCCTMVGKRFACRGALAHSSDSRRLASMRVYSQCNINPFLHIYLITIRCTGNMRFKRFHIQTYS